MLWERDMSRKEKGKDVKGHEHEAYDEGVLFLASNGRYARGWDASACPWWLGMDVSILSHSDGEISMGK